MDTIRINNLKIIARHGVYDFEKSKDGTFEIDLVLYCNLEKSGDTDELSDTVDYQEIISCTIEEFTKKRFSLVEAVANSVCNRLFAEFDIDKIVIRVRKPHAPIEADFKNVEVELQRVK